MPMVVLLLHEEVDAKPGNAALRLSPYIYMFFQKQILSDISAAKYFIQVIQIKEQILNFCFKQAVKNRNTLCI